MWVLHALWCFRALFLNQPETENRNRKVEMLSLCKVKVCINFNVQKKKNAGSLHNENSTSLQST